MANPLLENFQNPQTTILFPSCFGSVCLVRFFFYQISWIFVINQVPCVSSCWGEKTHTRGLQRKKGTPYQPLYQYQKKQQTNYSNQPLCSRPVKFFYSCFDMKVKKIRLYVINFFERICRSQFLEHRPHCRSEEPLKSVASKSSQLVDRRANDRAFYRDA